MAWQRALLTLPPPPSYIAALAIAVDKRTQGIGELVFKVKSNSSLLPIQIVSCGTQGGLPVDVMPKLTALATNASASTGRRRLHAAGMSATCLPSGALDPASLGMSVTTPTAASLAASDASPPLPASKKWRLAGAIEGGGVWITTADSGIPWTQTSAVSPVVRHKATVGKALCTSFLFQVSFDTPFSFFF